MCMEMELLSISIPKAHIGKELSALAAANVEAQCPCAVILANRRLELADLLTWHCLQAPRQLLKLYCPHKQSPSSSEPACGCQMG